MIPIRAAALALLTAIPVAIPIATAAAPALAGGALQVTLAPSNAREAQALRLGLALYALRQDVRTNGHVTQHGANNAAGLYQGGPNNQGIIHQEGQGHTGTLSQQGGNNAHGLFQFGQNSNAHVTQTGGQTGLTLVYGW